MSLPHRKATGNQLPSLPVLVPNVTRFVQNHVHQGRVGVFELPQLLQCAAACTVYSVGPWFFILLELVEHVSHTSMCNCLYRVPCRTMVLHFTGTSGRCITYFKIFRLPVCRQWVQLFTNCIALQYYIHWHCIIQSVWLLWRNKCLQHAISSAVCSAKETCNPHGPT